MVSNCDTNFLSNQILAIYFLCGVKAALETGMFLYLQYFSHFLNKYWPGSTSVPFIFVGCPGEVLAVLESLLTLKENRPETKASRQLLQASLRQG